MHCTIDPATTQMKFSLLSPTDVSMYDTQLFDTNGVLQPVAASWLDNIYNTASNDLRVFCHKHGIYGLMTHELISFIHGLIPEGSKTIEVAAGNGGFGKYLGITSTDSFVQNTPDMQAYYAFLGQPTVKYGAHVEELEASQAIAKYAPDVVFASWATQYAPPNAEMAGGGSIFGLKETEFMCHIKKYILYGNENIHGLKELFRATYATQWRVSSYRYPGFMFSRASDHTKNTLWVIDKI